jgi:GLPGLI family protein
MNTMKLFKIMINSILLCFVSFAAFAQSSIKLFIKYEFEHVSDTNKREVPIKGSQYLYVTEKESYFSNVQPADAQEEGQLHLSVMNNSTTDIMVSYINPFGNKEEPFLVDMIGRPYRIVEPNQKIKWELKEDKKDIGGYLCTKAVGDFGGRTYEAWFTNEIPYPVGPWKLNGLPGAILEAQDTKKEVIFHYAGLDKPARTIEMVDLSILDDLDFEKYLKAKENAQKDQMGAMLASLPADSKVIFKTEDGREISRDEMEAMMKDAEKKSEKFELNNPADLRFKKKK